MWAVWIDGDETDEDYSINIVQLGPTTISRGLVLR